MSEKFFITHSETFTFPQNEKGQEYAKRICDMWRMQGLGFNYDETTRTISISRNRAFEWREEVQE